MRGRAQAYTWARLCVSKDLSCLHTHTPIPFHSKRVIAESLPSFPLNFCPPLPLYPSIICFVSKCGVSILMWKGEINVARLPSVFMFVINPKKCYPCTIFLLPSVFSSCSWAALQMNVIWHQTSRFLFFFFSPFCLSAAVVFSFFFFFPEDEGKPCIKMARERRGGIFWVWQSAQIHTSLKLSKQWHLLKIPHWFRIQSGCLSCPRHARIWFRKNYVFLSRSLLQFVEVLAELVLIGALFIALICMSTMVNVMRFFEKTYRLLF